MTKLVAPQHIRGLLRGPGATRHMPDRRAFVQRAADEGHSVQAIATALGISPSTLRYNYRDILLARKPAAPKAQPKQRTDHSDRVVMVIRSGGFVGDDSFARRVTLPRAPWDATEITPDPRHETAPRHRGLVATPRVPGEELLAVLSGGLE